MSLVANIDEDIVICEKNEEKRCFLYENGFFVLVLE